MKKAPELVNVNPLANIHVKRTSKKGPKAGKRAAEVQSIFGLTPSATRDEAVLVPRPPPPTMAEIEAARRLQTAIADTGRAEYEKSIREYKVPLSSIPIPRKENIFGNPAVLEPLLVVLLDEESVIQKVLAGVLPVTTYATARELARIVQNTWPAELHIALTQYQASRVRMPKAPTVNAPTLIVHRK